MTDKTFNMMLLVNNNSVETLSNLIEVMEEKKYKYNYGIVVFDKELLQEHKEELRKYGYNKNADWIDGFEERLLQ